MFQQQSRATFHSSSRLPLPPLSYFYFLIRLSTPSVCLSLLLLLRLFSSFLFFFISFRDPYPAVYFSPRLFEEIRGTTNGRGNETDNRTAVPSRGRICLPFGSRVVSVEGGEREREKKKKYPVVDLYRSLYTRFVSYSIPSPAPRFVLFSR